VFFGLFHLSQDWGLQKRLVHFWGKESGNSKEIKKTTKIKKYEKLNIYNKNSAQTAVLQLLNL
jgi:hypothetical protein